MFPVVIACIVGIVLGGYALALIGESLGDYGDPNDWEDSNDR